MTIGDFIRARRKARGISQQELARRMSIGGQIMTHRRVSNWELGRNTPPLEDREFVNALATALELSLQEFLKAFYQNDVDNNAL